MGALQSIQKFVDPYGMIPALSHLWLGTAMKRWIVITVDETADRGNAYGAFKNECRRLSEAALKRLGGLNEVAWNECGGWDFQKWNGANNPLTYFRGKEARTNEAYKEWRTYIERNENEFVSFTEKRDQETVHPLQVIIEMVIRVAISYLLFSCVVYATVPFDLIFLVFLNVMGCVSYAALGCGVTCYQSLFSAPWKILNGKFFLAAIVLGTLPIWYSHRKKVEERSCWLERHFIVPLSKGVASLFLDRPTLQEV